MTANILAFKALDGRIAGWNPAGVAPTAVVLLRYDSWPWGKSIYFQNTPLCAVKP